MTSSRPRSAEIHRENFAVYGARKVWRAARKGDGVGRDRVARLMKARSASRAPPGSARIRTTRPAEPAARPADLVERTFAAPAPNRLWVADLTYVWTSRASPTPPSSSMSSAAGSSAGGPRRASAPTSLSTPSRWPSSPEATSSPASSITPIAASKVNSSGRRNTSAVRSCDGARPKVSELVWAVRARMRSPGHPPGWRREHQQRFWAEIARGLSSEEAAVAAGLSPAVGNRWFRQGGGMRTVSPAELSGRYLSFAEREEIAILRAQGRGVREIAAPDRPLPVDDLAGAAPERSDPMRPA